MDEQFLGEFSKIFVRGINTALKGQQVVINNQYSSLSKDTY